MEQQPRVFRRNTPPPLTIQQPVTEAALRQIVPPLQEPRVLFTIEDLQARINELHAEKETATNKNEINQQIYGIMRISPLLVDPGQNLNGGKRRRSVKKSTKKSKKVHTGGKRKRSVKKSTKKSKKVHTGGKRRRSVKKSRK